MIPCGFDVPLEGLTGCSSANPCGGATVCETRPTESCSCLAPRTAAGASQTAQHRIAADRQVRTAHLPVAEFIVRRLLSVSLQVEIKLMLNPFAFLSLMLIPVFTFSSGQIHKEAASHEQLPRPKSSRVVAVTIDDLPVAGAAEGDLRRAQQVTAKLLKQITAHNIPVVGFVNERKTHVPGKEKEWIDLLRQWADVGLELGNHTYSHRSFQETPLEEFEAEVIHGETIITRLMRERRGMGLRYFRHPYLQTGSNPETKKAFERFLAERGYTVAPVTVGHYDWLYAAAYERHRVTAR